MVRRRKARRKKKGKITKWDFYLAGIILAILVGYYLLYNYDTPLAGTTKFFIELLGWGFIFGAIVLKGNKIIKKALGR